MNTIIVVVIFVILFGISLIVIFLKKHGKISEYIDTFEIPTTIVSFKIPEKINKKYKIFNPSLVKFGRDMIVVVRAEYFYSVNEKIQGAINNDPFPLRKKNNLLLYKIENCDFRKTPLQLSLQFEQKNIMDSFNLGFEDPRVFIRKDSLYALVSYYAYQKNVNVYCVKISDNLQSISTMFHPTNQYIEKNWNPFIPEKDLFVKMINPHQVIHINFETGLTNLLFSTESKKLSEKYPGNFCLRGSSKYIETDMGYLSIGHVRIEENGKLFIYYFNICYLVNKEPPYNILSFSEPFRLTKNYHIEFVSGIELVDDNVWIAYGLEDENAQISIVPIATMLDLAIQNIA